MGDDAGAEIQVIEWNMMDPVKFYPLSLLTSVGVRGVLYPLTVVKTRLQIQKQSSVYRGTWDAFRKIWTNEGVSGLYRGYWINTVQVVSSLVYVSVYERVRQGLHGYPGFESSRKRALIGGGCASLISQTFIVPFDVVSQHMMVIGNIRNSSPKTPSSMIAHSDVLNLVEKAQSRRGLLGVAVIKELYAKDGLRGFFRGYYASVMCYVPNSAMFWMFYTFYSEKLHQITPDYVPQLLIQCMAAPSAGITTTSLTNPLDLLRARLQVQRAPFAVTVDKLWTEERWRIFTKGLSARLISSLIFSTLIMVGYETMKRLSVRSDFKDKVRW